MSVTVDLKGRAIVESGGIVEQEGVRAFAVRGGCGYTYLVVLADAWQSCNCPAGQHAAACSHIAAARLLMEREIDRHGEANRDDLDDLPCIDHGIVGCGDCEHWRGQGTAA